MIRNTLNINTTYYPFGMLMPGREYSSESYRYGYQGSEKDDEVKGSGNSYTTYFRQLDPRLGRWLSVDPKSSAWESPYVSMGNNPVWLNDPMGDKIKIGKKKHKERITVEEKSHLVFNSDSDGNINNPKNYVKVIDNQDEIDAAAEANKKIDKYNAKHAKRNEKIDSKLDLFKGIGIDVEKAYNPKTGMLEGTNVHLDVDKASAPHIATIYATINSNKTYKINTSNSSDAVTFAKGKIFFSEAVLKAPMTDNVQKTMAAHMGSFLMGDKNALPPLLNKFLGGVDIKEMRRFKYTVEGNKIIIGNILKKAPNGTQFTTKSYRLAWGID